MDNLKSVETMRFSKSTEIKIKTKEPCTIVLDFLEDNASYEIYAKDENGNWQLKRVVNRDIKSIFY